MNDQLITKHVGQSAIISWLRRADSGGTREFHRNAIAQCDFVSEASSSLKAAHLIQSTFQRNRFLRESTYLMDPIQLHSHSYLIIERPNTPMLRSPMHLTHPKKFLPVGSSGYQKTNRKRDGRSRGSPKITQRPEPPHGPWGVRYRSAGLSLYTPTLTHPLQSRPNSTITAWNELATVDLPPRNTLEERREHPGQGDHRHGNSCLPWIGKRVTIIPI